MTRMSGLPPNRSSVRVERVRTEEEHRVPDDVDDQIQDQEEAGDADEELRADGRIEDARSR